MVGCLVFQLSAKRETSGEKSRQLRDAQQDARDKMEVRSYRSPDFFEFQQLRNFLYQNCGVVTTKGTGRGQILENDCCLKFQVREKDGPGKWWVWVQAQPLSSISGAT